MSERTRMAEHTPEGWALEETQAEVDRLEAELERERHDAWVAMDGTNVKALQAERDAYRDQHTRLIAGIQWVRGMCSDEEPYEVIDAKLAELLGLAGESSTTEE